MTRPRRCPDCPSVLTDRESMTAATRLYWHRVHAHGHDGTPPASPGRAFPKWDDATFDALLVEFEALFTARDRRHLGIADIEVA